MDIKRYVRDHEGLMKVLALIYRIVGFNSIKGKSDMKILCVGGHSYGVPILRIMEKIIV